MAAKIPVVEISRENLNPGTESWIQTSRKIKEALEDHGCFIVETSNDIVSHKLHHSIFSVAEELFDLPYETKIKNINLKPSQSHGNVPKLPGISPLLEGLNIDHAEALEDCQNFTTLMWPEGNDRFCQTAHAYVKVVTELEKKITMMVFESYGLDKYLESHSSSSAYLLRFLKYKKPKNNVDEEMINVVDPIAHTDKSFMSILHQNNIRGLEVQTKDGEWFTFEPSPSSFIIMAGEACVAWSNGRIKACYHKVAVKNEGEVRYSLGVFSYQTGIIKTPDELIDEQNPRQFKPFDHVNSMCYYEKSDNNRIKAISLNAALLF